MAGELVALRKQDAPASDNAADALFLRLKRIYRDDVEKARVWREEAVEDFRFRDGYQWTPEELEHLREQMRPAIVFNRIGVAIDAVVGSEIGNRRELRFIPREVTDSAPNEVLTSAADTFRDNCDAEDEETQAFKDNITAGMGWTEERLDYNDNPEGDLKIDRIDPMEMVWDRNASKSNLADAKQMFRVRRVCLREAREMFPEVEDEELNAAWAEYDDEREETREQDTRYENAKSRDVGDDNREVVLCCAQYYEVESYWKAAVSLDPTQPPQIAEIPDERFQALQARGMVLQAAKMTRRVVMQAWLGASGLLEPPQPTQTGTFTWFAMTGLWDDDKGVFYGIVRRMKDPQRWANKWLSQMMHILNSQAKGGIMAEQGAFEDIREAQKTWTRPDAITIVTKNALNGAAPKIAPKPVAQLPPGFIQLMQIADENIVKASGINMELLGMRDANQPGVLEYQRKQSGVAILATFFDSKRRHLKMQGRGLLHIIQNYLSDGRLIRIVGDDMSRYVPLAKEQTSGEFDVIVDDSPTSTNEKEKTWQLLTQMLPMFKDALGPKEALMLAEYSPLPASLVEKFKQAAAQTEQNQQNSPQAQMQQVQLQLERQKLMNEAAKIDADRMKAETDREIALINAETERQRIQADKVKAWAEMNRPQPQYPRERMN